ncbi:23S rRNA m(5)U-1939 methyltransferase [Stella humosa]|uniref:23S rRNA m(5)U-1939 methyltransferase n=1 Tax=Stella humosa TaxID=94 RepID=A0A3N1KXC9_9PROT|nr:class I SAM-dependent RNA methyltransferase [Stella humosa]ROP83419.1 23S rRNA m(5)U-1939 methyltransferase [Stella humosa]BBK29796.1 RNA methyltransferase [Stella humosa]
MNETMTVTALGSGGDGLAEAGADRLYIPFAAPGDRLLVARERKAGDGWRARIVERLADGPDRTAPACRHFGECGGCVVQHIAAPAYQAWKRARVVEAFAREGLDPGVIAPLVPAEPGDRRRLRLAVQPAGGRLLVGFNAAGSDRIVPISECPVAAPELVAILPALARGLAAIWPRRHAGDVALTLTEGGIDLLLVVPGTFGAPARTALARLAEDLDLARLSVAPDDRTAPEPVAIRRAPRVRFGGIAVTPPPGGFLQAGMRSEAVLSALVAEAVPAGATVADLHAGCGTFALAVAGKARRVLAFDRDAPALEALLAGARAGGVGNRVTVERRDLDRRPPTLAEMRTWTAAILDPPRAGAAALADALARSAVPRVVYVSCNPVTFARDAARLVAGGLRLEQATPVDQFLWSPHVELVAVFRRPA